MPPLRRLTFIPLNDSIMTTPPAARLVIKNIPERRKRFLPLALNADHTMTRQRVRRIMRAGTMLSGIKKAITERNPDNNEEKICRLCGRYSPEIRADTERITYVVMAFIIKSRSI